MRRMIQVGDCCVIISPHPYIESMDYACSMSKSVVSVLIRSTGGTSEPRYRHASYVLGRVANEPTHINWQRSNRDSDCSLNPNRKLFKVQAPYGAGVGNYIPHLRFNLYVFRTLWQIKPQIIYACDLDTFFPSFFYKVFRPVILIFDQFDPLSARVSNEFLRKLLDAIENACARKADIRITANIQRIPVSLREKWIEIKNQFPFELIANKQRDTQDVSRLFYGGILSEDRGLLDCVKIIQKKAAWRVDIFGEGPERSKLEKFIGTNIDIHNQLPHNELMSRAQSVDLYLAQYDPRSRNNRLTASNKLFEAAQLGIPLLTSKDTQIGEIVQEFNLGWAITFGDSKEFEAALDDYISMSETRRIYIVENLKRYFQSETNSQNSNILALENRITSMIKLEGK